MALKDGMLASGRPCHDCREFGQAILSMRRLCGCMMRAMSSPRRETGSSAVQLFVDSIPALIHTARPDGYLDYFNKLWLEYEFGES
jgi:hypothetical protein